LSRLEEQVRSKPRAALLEDVARAEALAGQLEEAVTYPEDWVIFRITGAKVALAHPDMLNGVVLRAELSTLVERLCAAAHHTLAEAGPTVDSAALCTQWGISRQTLTRLRRRGLVARRVLDSRQRARLVFRTEVVNQFQGAHKTELLRAAAFSRMGPEQEAAVLRRAARYRRVFKWTLNQAAARIAERMGRSHEGIRQVLRRAEVRANGAHEAPVFGEAPALAQGQQELLYRAWRRGVDVGLMARKTRRSRGAVRRAINMARARRLVELSASGVLEPHAVPAFTAKNAAEAILSPAPVRTNLGSASAPDVLAFIKGAQALGPPIGAEEKARLVAYQYLRFSAARAIQKLSRLHPGAGPLDRIETWLLWAARLKVELIRSELRVMLEALAARLGRPVDELPAGVLVRLLEAGIAAVGEAIDGFDPSRGGRLAAAAGLAVDRSAIEWAKQLSAVPGSAAARRASVKIPAGLAMPDWTRSVCAWQSFLEPDRRVRLAIESGKLAPELAAYLGQRYGLDGGPARTLAELARERKINEAAVVRLDFRARREAISLGRRD
jgi:hypothetical protein